MSSRNFRKTIRLLPLLGAALAGSAAAAAVGGGVLHVDDDAPLGGNGQSWSSPYRYLRDALLAASMPGSGVVEIRVAGGAYRPDLDEAGIAVQGSVSSSFGLLGGVAVRGGYAGFGAADPGERQVALYETVLSGELGGPNSLHVVTATGVGADAVIDGVTVEDGRAVGSCCANDRGGGLSIVGGGPTFLRCTIRSNSAKNTGGGAWVYDSRPTFIDCCFQENTCTAGAAAIHAVVGSVVTLIRCEVRGNTGTTAGGGTRGGLFISGNFGGTAHSSLIAHDTVFAQNTGPGGGALYVAGTATLVNCLFTGNVANGTAEFFDSGHGGAISNNGQITATNCTFVGNAATFSGGAIYTSRENPNTTLQSWVVIENSILWGNTSGADDEADQVHVVGNSTLTLEHSCVKGPLPPVAGTGSFSDDPLFLDELGPDGIPATGDENLRLGLGSPCVDSGNNGALPLDTEIDLAGSPRFRDDPAAEDCPTAPGTCGTAPIVDIGAFERQPPCAGDLDADGTVGAADLGLLIAAWGGTPGGDLDGDGMTTGDDLGLLLAVWGDCESRK